jgi:hypothetical protein
LISFWKPLTIATAIIIIAKLKAVATFATFIIKAEKFFSFCFCSLEAIKLETFIGLKIIENWVRISFNPELMQLN